MEDSLIEVSVAPSEFRISPVRWAILALGISGALYPLSLGPIMWLHDHDLLTTQVTDRLADTLYRPLAFLYDWSTIVASMFDWYLAFWTS